MEILTGIFGNLLFISLFIFCQTFKILSESKTLLGFTNKTTQIVSDLDIQILLRKLEKVFLIGMGIFFLLISLGLKNLFLMLGLFIFSWFFLSLKKFPLKFETYINIFLNANTEITPILKKGFFALLTFIGLVFLGSNQEKINIGNDEYMIFLLLIICFVFVVVVIVYMSHIVADFLIAIPSLIITTSLILSVKIAKLIQDVNIKTFNTFCTVFLSLASILYALKQYIISS